LAAPLPQRTIDAIVHISSPLIFKQKRSIVLTENSLSTHREALMTLLPIRIPESIQTVNMARSWPPRTLSDRVIFSRVLHEPMAPLTCRPPAKQKKNTRRQPYSST